MATDWFRLPTNFYLDARLARVGDAAEVLYLRAAALATSQELRGVIHPAYLQRLTKHSPRKAIKLADSLVEVGLWEKIPDGYQIVDWKKFAKPKYRQQIPLQVRLAIYARDGHACVACGATDSLSLDHIFPWSLGGSDEPENLQTLCLPCNMRKGARV